MSQLADQDSDPRKDFDPRAPLQAGDEDESIEETSGSDTSNDPRPGQPPPYSGSDTGTGG